MRHCLHRKKFSVIFIGVRSGEAEREGGEGEEGEKGKGKWGMLFLLFL